MNAKQLYFHFTLNLILIKYTKKKIKTLQCLFFHIAVFILNFLIGVRCSIYLDTASIHTIGSIHFAITSDFFFANTILAGLSNIYCPCIDRMALEAESILPKATCACPRIFCSSLSRSRQCGQTSKIACIMYGVAYRYLFDHSNSKDIWFDWVLLAL